MRESEQLQAFSPIVGERPVCLILGSMPSAVSLREQQYYGHSRNAFWPIMGSIFSFDANQPYTDRKRYLINNGVAVWDVLQSCQREGSLDSAIQLDSEVANSFDLFFTRWPSIQSVLFNGQAAAKIFKRHLPKIEQQFDYIEWQTLPSTSPAYASITFDQKRQAWHQHLHQCYGKSVLEK